MCTDQAQIICLQIKTIQNRSKQICIWILTWKVNRRLTLSLEEALLWTMNSIWVRSDGLWKNKNALMICFLQTQFSLHKILIDGLQSCGLLVDCCDVFISCLDSQSDGTHSLQSIHWWACNVKCFCSPNLFWWRNKLNYILYGLNYYIFMWTIPLT